MNRVFKSERISDTQVAVLANGSLVAIFHNQENAELAAIQLNRTLEMYVESEALVDMLNRND